MLAAFFDQQEKIAMTYGFFDELSKLAEKELSRGEKALSAVDTARPDAHRAMVGALPGAVIGTALGHLRKSGKPGAVPAIGALIGAGAGMGDLALERMAKKNRKFKKIMTSYNEKSSAMAGDLRQLHVGEAKPPTEDSKIVAARNLSSAQSVGKFNNAASNRSIAEVGPKIKDLVIK